MRKPRIGVAGAGVGEEYVASFTKLAGVELTAICARTTQRAEDIAERYGLPAVYLDYDQMLESERLDAVVIAVPNHLHHPFALKAIRAGMSVLCDKPLGMSSTQTAELVTAARETPNVTHMVPFVWRFLPATQQICEMINQGFIGKPFLVNVEYLSLGWGDPAGPMRWQFDRARAGSGSIGWLGSHAIDLIHWWLGEFSMVSANLGTAFRERHDPHSARPDIRTVVDVDDHAVVLGTLENDVTVTMTTSSVAHVDRVRLEASVHGTEGSVRFLSSFATRSEAMGAVFARRAGESRTIRLSPPPHLAWDKSINLLDSRRAPLAPCFDRIAARFADSIARGSQVEPNFYDGHLVQRVINAVESSNRDRRWTLV